MKKLFAFASLALSTVTLASTPAMALPVNTPLAVELDFAGEEYDVGTLTFRSSVFDSVNSDYEEACRYNGAWTIYPAASVTANLYLDETKIDGQEDCYENSEDFIDTDMSLAMYPTSKGFDPGYQKMTVVRLRAGEDGEGEDTLVGSIKFYNGARYSFEAEPSY